MKELQREPCTSKLFPTVAPAKLPVSVITGFLGSGKTTLLNRLLRQPEMAKTAVIINEFGEVPLDGALIGSQAGEVVTLANGCMCCVVGDDFKSAMGNLYRGVGSAGGETISRILIETSGLADPAPIVGSLLNSPLMSSWCVLDSVITTADAAHLVTQIAEHTEAVSQIAFADRVVLTKGDLVSASQLAEVKSEVRRHNQHGELIEARNGDISAAVLFGVQSRGGKANVAHLEEVMRRISAHSQDHDHGHGGGHHHVHTPAVKAFAIVDAGEIEWARFNSWFRDLRIKHGDDLLRVKGILDIRGETKPVVVHGVRHIFHPPSALKSWTGIERGSRLVFIIRGAGLEDLIKQSFIRDVGSDGARVK